MSLKRSGGGAVGVALALFAIVLAMLAGPAAAQQTGAQAAPVIQSIVVQGNQRIETETIKSYLVVAPGDRADPALLDAGLKTLMNTGLFSDASLQMQPGGVLLISVKENPIVNRIILEGNKHLKDDKITDEIQLKAREVFTRAKVQADVERIIELYRRSGRFAATITPKVTPLDQNRVDVIYEIDEGPKTGIAKINFIGNKVFSDNELRGVVLTKESHWWKIFSSNTNYDPDRLEYDQELLRQFYARHGYADFQVTSAVAELTPDRKNFFITFTVEEGPQYRIGDVKVKTTLAKIDEKALERFVPVRSGEIYDGDKVDKAVEAITFATGATGYAFVDVNPRLDRHPENKTVDITFNVNEGPRVYVERINIKGNTRTLDKVIRREIRIAEGDPFNRVLVDRSKSRIKALDYFSDVTIDEKPGSAPDRTDLDVQVKEKSTGSFSVGVGISSTERFIVDLSIEERNLMGRGQYLRFQVQASSRTRQVNIQFTQPYFLDRNLAAGFSIFNQRTNFRESGFVRDRIGFGLNAGFQISEFGRGGLNYFFTRDNVQIDTLNSIQVTSAQNPQDLVLPGVTVSDASTCVAGSSSACLTEGVDLLGNPVTLLSSSTCNFVQNALTPTCDSQGKFITSLIGYSIAFDKRDDPIDPTHGWRFSLAQSVAGLGGSVNYYRTEVSGAYYHPVVGKFIGALKFRAGYVDGYGGDSVRLSDRFFEGAETFRGFEVAGVGPRYIPQGQGVDQNGQIRSQSIGGKVYAIGTAEVLLPLPLPKEYGIKVSAFSDFGTVGLVDNRTKALNEDLSFWVDPTGSGIYQKPVQDDLALRVSAGVTVSWDSPFGPIRFDLARVIKKEFYDRTESFRFSAGTSF
ncbi:MAG: outer membrane protein assembly factor BamA [Alphaproteobacteria bacterium]|nr:outer membrane protein assembly factor BamA [Alphaproteobacteria bacterium]